MLIRSRKKGRKGKEGRSGKRRPHTHIHQRTARSRWQPPQQAGLAWDFSSSAAMLGRPSPRAPTQQPEQRVEHFLHRSVAVHVRLRLEQGGEGREQQAGAQDEHEGAAGACSRGAGGRGREPGFGYIFYVCGRDTARRGVRMKVRRALRRDGRAWGNRPERRVQKPTATKQSWTACRHSAHVAAPRRALPPPRRAPLRLGPAPRRQEQHTD
jgi:hypothetical protein